MKAQFHLIVLQAAYMVQFVGDFTPEQKQEALKQLSGAFPSGKIAERVLEGASAEARVLNVQAMDCGVQLEGELVRGGQG